MKNTNGRPSKFPAFKNAEPRVFGLGALVALKASHAAYDAYAILGPEYEARIREEARRSNDYEFQDGMLVIGSMPGMQKYLRDADIEQSEFDMPVRIRHYLGSDSLSMAFSGFKSFDRPVEIPEGFTDLTYAFSRCSKLRQPIAIPASAEKVRGMLHGCDRMRGMEIRIRKTDFKSFDEILEYAGSLFMDLIFDEPRYMPPFTLSNALTIKYGKELLDYAAENGYPEMTARILQLSRDLRMPIDKVELKLD